MVMFANKETGESLICSVCKQTILFKPNNYSDEFVKLQHLKHINKCKGEEPKSKIIYDIEPEDIRF